MSEHITWCLDSASVGGIVCERLLAALPLGDNLYCGLVFTFDTAGAPRIQFWERIDDLEAQGFEPISASRARAIYDALPRFLERLEQSSVVSRQSSEQDDRGDAVRAGVGLC